MKIGVITYHQALNYGAALQTYALQRYILSKYQDVDVEVIDYKNHYLEMIKSYNNCISKNILFSVLRIYNLAKKRHVFSEFYKKNVRLSKEYSKDSIEQVNEDYSTFIAGSDQIWNPRLNGNDSAYLLSFVKSKKIYSYAASFGLRDVPDDCKDWFIHYLNRFNMISVREKSGLELLEKLKVQAPSRTDIDPTLLLNQEEWNEICDNNFNSKNFVLVYSIVYSSDIIRIAKECAKKKKMKVYYVGPFCMDRGIKYIPAPSVEKLIALFKNAEHTFVSSFHGTVFSIIYHKSFTAVMPYSDGRNERVLNLLRAFNLEKCIYNEKNMKIEVIDNWDSVENKLRILRKESEKYIEDIINENRTN